MLNKYDFACASEASQEMEALNPKFIEAVGSCGTELQVADFEEMMKDAEALEGADFVPMMPVLFEHLDAKVGDELSVIDMDKVIAGEAGTQHEVGDLVLGSVRLQEEAITCLSGSVKVYYKLYEEGANGKIVPSEEKEYSTTIQANEEIEAVDRQIDVTVDSVVLTAITISQPGLTLLAEMPMDGGIVEDRVNTKELKYEAGAGNSALTQEIIDAATVVDTELTTGSTDWVYDTDHFYKINGFELKVTDFDDDNVYVKGRKIFLKGGKTGNDAIELIVPEGKSVYKLSMSLNTKKNPSTIKVCGGDTVSLSPQQIEKVFDVKGQEHIKIETGDKKIYATIKIYGV